jgi:hypothetical protein
VGYHIAVDGAFDLTPAANEAARGQVASAGTGWVVSPNGRLLYLPDDHPRAFEGLKRLVEVVLPELGLSASGSLAWRGEDGAEGRVSIGSSGVRVDYPAEEGLSDSEVQQHARRLLEGTKAERMESADILDAFRASMPAVVEALTAVLRHEDLEVRMKAASVLTSFGADAVGAVPGLVLALEDSEPWMQAAAAEALGAIGSGAATALPALERLTTHPSYGPAGRAREAIGRIRS